jgi:TRAP-type C4-dicarboxylate transport system permease small subunit
VKTFEKVLQSLTQKFALIAMGAMVACMVVVVSDVVKGKVTGIPFPGTYEHVELIAAVVMSMGISYLTFVRGHVWVGVIVDRFRPRTQAIFDIVNGVISLGITILLTRALFLLAGVSRIAGSETQTLKIPLYPFIYVVAASLAVTCVVLIRDVVKAAITAKKRGEP